MTEDDTFEALRRLTLEQLLRQEFRGFVTMDNFMSLWDRDSIEEFQEPWRPLFEQHDWPLEEVNAMIESKYEVWTKNGRG